MNQIEIKKQILEQVFKSNHVRKLKHVLKEIAEYKDMRAYLEERGKKKNRKAIKDITKRLRTLHLELQGYHSVGNGMRGDPAPSPGVVEQLKGDEGGYVYTGSSRHKTGSGDKRRLRDKVLNARHKKEEW